MIVVEMDDSLDLITVIDQANMTSDCYIAVLAWRRWQLAHQIGGRGMRLPAHILIENGARMQTGLLIG